MRRPLFRCAAEASPRAWRLDGELAPLRLMTTFVGLQAFEILCRCGNELAALREACAVGSEAWVGLTQLVQAVDMIVDAVVEGPAIEEDA
ncbi:MAG TPA: hypothetical protein VI542_37790 [Candidatus Tectomicrobia bacterium]